MEWANAKLHRCSLSDEELHTNGDPGEGTQGNGSVHVLVTVPEQQAAWPQRPAAGPQPPVKRMKMDLVPRSNWFISDLKSMNDVQISTEEWLQMTFNGNVLNLQIKDEDLRQEQLKRTGFKYFDINFPLLLSKVERDKQSVSDRPCYETLYDILLKIIMDAIPSISITGNPGVGKRRFYAYCVYRLTKEPLEDRVLIINANQLYYVYENDCFRKLTFPEVEDYALQPTNLRLIDGRSSWLLGWSGVSIVFTSPGLSDYGEFLKLSGVEYVMPPWSRQELSVAATVVQVDQDQIDQRYSRFGGIARYVFAKTATLIESKILEAISKMDLLRLFQVVNIDEEVAEKNYCHRLLHMYPKHTDQNIYQGFYLDFDSDDIGDKIYDRMVTRCFEKMSEFIVANEEDADSGGFRGTLFKKHCHCLWSGRGTNILLGKYMARSEGKEEKLSIENPDKIDVVSFTDLTDTPAFTAEKPLYCRPKGNTFLALMLFTGTQKSVTCCK